MKRLIVILIGLIEISCQQKGHWVNNPDFIFPKDNWSYIMPDNSVDGHVREKRTGEFNAFFRGSYCGAGWYSNLESAKACVEWHAKYDPLGIF